MTKNSEIRLLGTVASPYVNRVQFVCNLKSIDYEFVAENLACKSELLLTSNPIHKKVPVLLHANESPTCESLVIIQYLEEIKPDVHPIFPSAPAERANNRFWAHYIDNQFFPLYEKLRITQGKERKEAIKQEIIEGSIVLEEAFVKTSKGKAYFGGDDVGFLDVVLGCFLSWTYFVEKENKFKIFDEVRTPRLVEWTKRIWSHEAIKSVIPTNEIISEFYMMLQKYRPLGA
ncbi:glutathione S-transferase U17-like [Cynara cardunculus var. scolymus]|uniref:Glutathione S-transferase n=1 Tax=Cynara cardunculus var. scolymus TaxID=59895 RepID=A0A103XSN6_CYNCS|nr:glutathione S-transferase U17-like [Cynara cardunculus var. scolymus]KVH96104.1 Glutathione S-transferase/chloride channel, C-terminal [Cynara cardunculus var. scolymus]